MISGNYDCKSSSINDFKSKRNTQPSTSITVDSSSNDSSDNNSSRSLSSSECELSFSSDCDTEINAPDNAIDDTILHEDILTSLGKWSVENNITQNALGSLLKSHDCFKSFPKDPRTILKTSQVYETKYVSPGNYVHFGIEKGIKNMCMQGFSSDKILLSVNIDGLPISKSSSSVFWPILGSIIPANKVFIIGMYHGLEKPHDANEYLRDFVQEAQHLSQNGILVNGEVLDFCVRHIICDAPAKAFILGIKSHGGYHCCTKCKTKGIYKKRRVCFPEKDAYKRTDEEFQIGSDENYHLHRTILCEIPNLGLVTNVPLDYMHLVCLGVMRKLLNIWVKGELPNRLPYSDVDSISKNLLTLIKYIPAEFARKPRSLSDLAHWKATEFRQILLYTGPLVFSKISCNKWYLNFLSLHVSLRILCSEHFEHEILLYSHSLLEHFVKNFASLYGQEYVSYNVHGLLHLCDDVLNFGCLDNFSAFKYENYLARLKCLIRKPEKPLQQLIRRYSELITFGNPVIETSINVIPCFSSPHSDGPVIGHDNCQVQYKKAKFKDFILIADSLSDSCCLLKNGEIVLVKNFISSSVGNYFLIGSIFKKRRDLFELPCKSSLINIYVVSRPSAIQLWPISSVLNKLVSLPHENDLAVFPLLH